MEGNHMEKTGTKRKLLKFIVPLIIGLTLCGIATIGVLNSNQFGIGSKDSSNNVKTLLPVASTAKELQELLLKSGKLTITIKEDIVVEEPLLVKGNKKIKGNHTISMALDAKPYQNIFSVLDDASLTVDEITVDGNGIANCIYVEPSGELNLSSGKLVYGFPYGVEVSGKVTMEGATVEHAMCAGMSVVAGGEAYFTKGEIINSVDSALHIGKGGYASISEDIQMWDSGEFIVTNYGKVEITGGSIGGAHKTLIKNLGELSIQGTEDKKVELCDAGRYGIWSTKESTLTQIDGLYLHDTGYTGILLAASKNVDIRNSTIESVGRDGIYATSKAEGNIENVVIKSAGTPGINSNTSSKLTAKNITIEKPGTVGLYAQNGGVIEAENIVIKEPTQRGIMCVGGNVTGKNIEINSPGIFGITCANKEELRGRVILENATITNVGTRNGINIVTGGLVRITGGVISNVTKENGAKVHGEGSRLELKDVDIKNCGYYGILTQKDARVVVENATISNCKDGVVGEVDSGTILKNVTVADSIYYGVYAKKGSAIKVEDVVVKSSKERGIVSIGGRVYGKNVEITSAGIFGITCASEGDYKGTVTLENTNISDITERNGINIVTGGKVTITGGTISKIAKQNGAKIHGEGSRLELKNVDIKDCGYYGILTQKDARVVLENTTISNCLDGVVGEVDSGTILQNVTVSNSTYYGVYAKKGSAIKVVDVTVKDSKERGIVSLGGRVYGKNVEIANTGVFGITCASEKEYKGTVTLENTNITNVTQRNGINIVTGGMVQITGGTISGIVTENGAKIHGEDSKLVLQDVDIKDCAVNGILAQVDSEANLTNVKFENCDGSAIYCDGGVVAGDTVSTKTVVGYGVHCENAGEVAGNVNISNLTVEAGTTGDGLSATGGSNVTVKKGTISNTKGTAVYINRSSVDLTEVTIDSAGAHGVYNNNGTITAADTSIVTPKYSGLYTKGENGQTFLNAGEGNNIVSNSGENDIYVCENAKATISSSVFSDSTLHSVLCEVGTIELDGVTIERAGSAGVYLLGKGSNAIINNSVIENSKERGIRCEGGSVTGENMMILSPTKYGITCNAKDDTTGSVILKDVTISNVVNGSYGINVLGASYCEITGGTIDEGKTGIGARAYGENSKLVLKGVDIKNCGTTGVATYNYGEAILEDVEIRNCSNGVLTEVNAKASLTEVDIIDCSSTGIYSKGGTLTGIGVDITNPGNYGVLDRESGDVAGAVTLTRFSVNNAKKYGLYVRTGSSLIATTGTIANVTEENGAYNSNGTLSLTDVRIDGSKTSGIYVVGKDTVNTLTNVTIANAGVHGIQNESGTINGNTVKIENVTTNCINCSAEGTMTINNLIVTGGKGMDVQGTSNVTVNGGSISGNAGSAVYCKQAAITLNDFTITESKGSAIYNNNGTVTASDITISKAGGASVYTKNANGITTLNKVNKDNSISGSVSNDVCAENGARIIVNNACFTGSTGDSVLNKGGNITLNTVTIQDVNQHGIYCQGGSLTGNTVYVVNSKDVGIQMEANAQGELKGVEVSNCANVAIKCINARLIVDTLTVSGCAGALYTEGADAFLDVKNGNFTFATKCSGVYCKSGAEIVLDNVAMVIDNTKTNQVNSIYMNGGKITGTNVTITGTQRNTYSYLTLFNNAETSINGKAYESEGTNASTAKTYKYCNNNAVNATEFYTTAQ